MTTPVSGFFQTGPCRLDHQTGVETSLLVSRWSKVIVCEHGSKRTVFQVVVENIVGKPALDGGLCAESAEERMGFRFRTRKRAVARVTRIRADASILLANGVNAFDHVVGTKRSVFIIEAITRAV